MKDFRCLLGFHDWTQWRRKTEKSLRMTAPISIDGSNMVTVTKYTQHRRCKRCGKQESRPVPPPRLGKPPGPE